MRDYEAEVGRILEKRYKLLHFCGSGASGAVFRAYDIRTGKEVAVKLFSACESGGRSKSFANEARAISKLSSPYIVKLYGIGEDNGDNYLVMEYVDGTTLRAFIDRYEARNERIPLSQILSCARQVLNALKAAHAADIVHRDIKPQNIMLMKTGKLKVMDFGVAKPAGGDPLDGEHHAVGTAYYISPEQAGSGVVDMRSDIYSLGVMLYEMATGRLPYSGGTPTEVARMHMTDTPPLPRDVDDAVPVGLEQIIMTAIEKNPDRRFRNADEMLKAIGKLSENPEYVFSGFADSTATNAGMRRFAAEKHTSLPVIVGAVAAAMTVALTVTVISLLYGNGFFGNQNVTLSADNLPSFAYDAVCLMQENGVTVACVYEISEVTPGDTVKVDVSETFPEKGSHAVLHISLGLNESAKMPNVCGMTLGDAAASLMRAGIVYSLDAVSSSLPVGRVVSQSLPAGSIVFVSKNSAVTLYISEGNE